MLNELSTKAEVERILEKEDIITVFQPIVSLIDGEILGYEALSRGPKDSPLHLPNELFNAAEYLNKTWEMEFLCRKKALEKVKLLEKGKLLFINIDPKIFNDEKFTKGMTREFLKKYDINPESIIFEITEKTTIEDYKSFKRALDNYKSQGYQIAIDDTGAGFSGLKLLIETKPQFVKIDMDLIRNIDKDTFKQALINALVNLSKVTDMKLIAEGIETKEELKTLIDLKVYAGQGFYLQRPAGTFLDLKEEIKSIILYFNKQKNNNLDIYVDYQERRTYVY